MKLSRAPARLEAAPRALRAAPKVADPLYTSVGWRVFSARLKAQRGWKCQQCGFDGTDQRRLIHADHVIEIKDGGAAFDAANILIRCQPCHNAKTAKTAAARR